MDIHKTEESSDQTKKKIMNFINSHEFFWLKDLKKHLEITTYESHEDIKLVRLSRFIRFCVKDGILQCAQNKRSEKQYVRIKKFK